MKKILLSIMVLGSSYFAIAQKAFVNDPNAEQRKLNGSFSAIKISGGIDLYLSQFDKRFTLFRDKGQLLASRQVSKDDAKAYIATLFPEPADKSSDTKMKHHNEKIAELRGIHGMPQNNLPAMRGSWWAMVNTVTQFIDHNGNYRGTAQAKAERRFLTVADGAKADLKNKAFDLACEMAGVQLAVAA